MMQKDSLKAYEGRERRICQPHYLKMHASIGWIPIGVNSRREEDGLPSGGQEFTLRFAVGSTSVSLVDGTPAFRSPSR
jgi:hypothetical protein